MQYLQRLVGTPTAVGIEPEFDLVADRSSGRLNERDVLLDTAVPNLQLDRLDAVRDRQIHVGQRGGDVGGTDGGVDRDPFERFGCEMCCERQSGFLGEHICGSAGERRPGLGRADERVEHVADHVLIEAKPRHVDLVVKRFELLHRPPRHRAEVAPTNRAVVVESHEGTPAVGDDRMRGGHR